MSNICPYVKYGWRCKGKCFCSGSGWQGWYLIVVSQEVLGWWNQVLMGDFNYPCIYWEKSMAVHKSSIRFLGHVEVWLLLQMVDVLTRNNALPNLLLMNQGCLTTTSGTLEQTDHNSGGFKILLSTLKTRVVGKRHMILEEPAAISSLPSYTRYLEQ